ncbi:MAG: hypothetical protein ACYDAO_04215 [Thermoplasmataceae archaeon]
MATQTVNKSPQPIKPVIMALSLIAIAVYIYQYLNGLIPPYGTIIALVIDVGLVSVALIIYLPTIAPNVVPPVMEADIRDLFYKLDPRLITFVMAHKAEIEKEIISLAKSIGAVSPEELAIVQVGITAIFNELQTYLPPYTSKQPVASSTATSTTVTAPAQPTKPTK